MPDIFTAREKAAVRRLRIDPSRDLYPHAPELTVTDYRAVLDAFETLLNGSKTAINNAIPPAHRSRMDNRAKALVFLVAVADWVEEVS